MKTLDLTNPASINWETDLSSLTALPEGLKLPDTIGGGLDLSSLTALPEGLKLPDTIRVILKS